MGGVFSYFIDDGHEQIRALQRIVVTMSGRIETLEKQMIVCQNKLTDGINSNVDINVNNEISDNTNSFQWNCNTVLHDPSLIRDIQIGNKIDEDLEDELD